jgi:hypothetical protein
MVVVSVVMDLGMMDGQNRVDDRKRRGMGGQGSAGFRLVQLVCISDYYERLFSERKSKRKSRCTLQ